MKCLLIKDKQTSFKMKFGTTEEKKCESGKQMAAETQQRENLLSVSANRLVRSSMLMHWHRGMSSISSCCIEFSPHAA